VKGECISLLFDKKIEPSCSYCRYGTALGCDEVACIRRGIMSASGSCGAFRYEPTKREPQASPSLNPTEFTEEDFRI